MNDIVTKIALIRADNALDWSLQAMEKMVKDLTMVREAAETLLRASEVNRAFDINSKDDFQEMYPGYADYANGDIDEVLLQAQDKVRQALKKAYDPSKKMIQKK